MDMSELLSSDRFASAEQRRAKAIENIVSSHEGEYSPNDQAQLLRLVESHIATHNRRHRLDKSLESLG